MFLPSGSFRFTHLLRDQSSSWNMSFHKLVRNNFEGSEEERNKGWDGSRRKKGGGEEEEGELTS